MISSYLLSSVLLKSSKIYTLLIPLVYNRRLNSVTLYVLCIHSKKKKLIFIKS